MCDRLTVGFAFLLQHKQQQTIVLKLLYEVGGGELLTRRQRRRDYCTCNDGVWKLSRWHQQLNWWKLMSLFWTVQEITDKDHWSGRPILCLMVQYLVGFAGLLFEFVFAVLQKIWKNSRIYAIQYIVGVVEPHIFDFVFIFICIHNSIP